MTTCIACKTRFTITPEDGKFYQKMAVSEPTRCPRCRQARRLTFRNEINFYHRKCDKTGKPILSMYPPDSKYPIYDQTEWWKDDWDGTTYAQEFDFSRPFFEQFEELRRKVPRMSLNAIANENSYYTNYALRNKNCYLVTTADYNEECYYGRFSDRNYRCVDIDFTYDSRFCYFLIDAHNCEKCFFSQKLDSCSENYFCYDMRNCHNCLFSSNQRNQSYLVWNKKVSKEEFEAAKKALSFEVDNEKARDVWRAALRKNFENVSCEDSVGDYLKNCKNAKFCFDSYDLQDCAYCSIVFKIKDCYDWDFVGENSERCYEMVSSAGNNRECRFCMNVWQGNSNLTYCDLCLGSENLFGCVGLRKKKYCILNKQYSKEEYEELVPKIIDHMKKNQRAHGASAQASEIGSRGSQLSEAELTNKEYGEFFPAELSPFAYKDSLAQEFYPLPIEEKIAPADVARNAGAHRCIKCAKPFKLIDQEVSFYKEMNLPEPKMCWLCRHFERRALRNPRVVHTRPCMSCDKEIYTTYAPEGEATAAAGSRSGGKKVYCEACYLAQIN